MFVEEIMKKEFSYLNPSDKLSEAISKMENEKVLELPVIENNKVIGILRLEDLISSGMTDPSKQKVDSLSLIKPPKLSADNSIEEAAEAIFKSGLREIPVIQEEKISGVISAFDIIKAVSKEAIFKNTNISSIMSPAEVISYDTDIGTARVLMREKGYSILPVVDAAGELVGTVDFFDLLKALEKPRERMGWYCMAAEMDRIMGIPVSTVTNNTPVFISKDNDVSKVSSLIAEKNYGSVVILDNKKPVGVITIRDLIDLYNQGLSKKGVYYHLIGTEGIEPFILETVERMIKDSVQKIGSSVPIEFLTVHIKKHKESGIKNKYSIRVRLRTDKGTFISKAWKWDPRDAVKEALDHLEKVFIKRKEKNIDKIKRDRRRLKGT